MYRIVTKEALKPTVILYEIEAPMVAKKADRNRFGKSRHRSKKNTQKDTGPFSCTILHIQHMSGSMNNWHNQLYVPGRLQSPG